MSANTVCSWAAFAPPTIRYCEAALCAWIQAPANTWSNLGFIAVGLIIIFREKKTTGLGFMGAILVLIGIFSGLYHASGTRWAQFLDLASMYFLAAFLFTRSLKRLGLLSARLSFGIFIFLIALALLLLAVIPPSGNAIFAFLVTACVAAEWKIAKKVGAQKYGQLGRAAALWGVAQTAWILDLSRIVCDPNNHWMQGHAVWHILMAAATWHIYRFYAENADSPEPDERF